MKSLTTLISRLAEITNEVFCDLCEDLKDRPVLVPLSGGLDSRLVLAKLHEFDHPNVAAFSYGVYGNDEAKIARQVARRLSIPWFFIPSNHKRFLNCGGFEYWEYADGLSSLPFMQDVDVLQVLLKHGKIAKNTIVVNGQTGDFITGGHIPKALIGKDKGDIGVLVKEIIKKHYSMWSDLKTAENVQTMSGRIKEILKPYIGICTLTQLYELWEWQERQSKYVVNGQRAYDWLDLEWRLPLWDDRLMEFWLEVPVEQKLEQKLYKSYLKEYNYKNVFDISIQVNKWPGMRYIIVLIARAIGLFFGPYAKGIVYKYGTYFGSSGYQFHYWGLPWFLRRIKHARNALSFMVIEWVERLRNDK